MKEYIGCVGVDSGQILICDPCALDTFESDEFWPDTQHPTKHDAKQLWSYGAACAVSLDEECPAGEILHGVVSSTYGGDGLFPVYAVFDRERRPIRLIIELCEEEHDDE